MAAVPFEFDVESGKSRKMTVEGKWKVCVEKAWVEECKEKEAEYGMLSITLDNRKLVFGSLHTKNRTETCSTLEVDRTFEIHHSLPTRTVFFSGYIFKPFDPAYLKEFNERLSTTQDIDEEETAATGGSDAVNQIKSGDAATTVETIPVPEHVDLKLLTDQFAQISQLSEAEVELMDASTEAPTQRIIQISGTPKQVKGAYLWLRGYFSNKGS